MIRQLGSGEVPIHTITADNGKEFADHIHVAKALDAKFFFRQTLGTYMRKYTKI